MSRNLSAAPRRQQLEERLRPHGQQHLLQFWESLTPAGQSQLARQIEALDLPLVKRLFHYQESASDWAQLVERAAPPPAFRLRGTPPIADNAARAAGEALLRGGQVGAILVAGGQGSRLGFDHAKGLYPIGPVSGASLFQILIEKLRAAAQRYATRIPLWVMTSPATDAETRDFFARHDRFGLAAEDLQVFCQATLPALDRHSGQILLEARDCIATSPDGHGGMLPALATSGELARIAARGITQLFYFQIDNPLVSVCDPLFLGRHVLSQAEMSTQAIAKQHPHDRVGNILAFGDTLRVVEYSEFNQLDDRLTGQRDANGSLRFWAGSTAVHAFATSFLARMASQVDALPFHVAIKRVATVDAQGNPFTPSEPQAIKFERFVFDLMPQARHAQVMEIDARREFGPLKNASGSASDTPESVRAQMIDLHAGWLRHAGWEIAPGVPVEVSPLLATSADQLRAALAPGVPRRIAAPSYLSPTTLQDFLSQVRP